MSVQPKQQPPQPMVEVIDGVRVVIRCTPPADPSVRTANLREILARVIARQGS